MTGLLPTTGIFVASAPVDVCKTFDGLAILVRNNLGNDPMDGSLYVFSNRRRDRIGILIWKPGGYWLCTRRLVQGTFRWPKRDEPSVRNSREELTLLLGSIDLAQNRKRKWYRRETLTARHFLLKLHKRGWIKLPACRRRSPNRMIHRQLVRVPLDRSPVCGSLPCLGKLELYEVSADAERRGNFEPLLAEEHYLGYRSAVVRT